MPTASTHSVVSLWCVSTLSMTTWKNIGDASDSICMATAAIRMSRKAAFCFSISGMNQLKPKRWFGSVILCSRLTNTTAPSHRAQNVSRSSRTTLACAACGSRIATLPSPSARAPTTMTALPLVRRAISGKTPPCASRPVHERVSARAFRPMSAAMRSSSRSPGSSAPSAYSEISRSGLTCNPWCWAIAVRHWTMVWGNLSAMLRGKTLPHGLGRFVRRRWAHAGKFQATHQLSKC